MSTLIRGIPVCCLNTFLRLNTIIYFFYNQCTIVDDFLAARCLSQVKFLKYREQRHLAAKIVLQNNIVFSKNLRKIITCNT